MIFQLILVLLALLSFGYYKLTKHRDYWSDRNVPNTGFKLFWGDDMGLIKGQESFPAWVKRVYENNPNERFVGMWRMLGSPYLMIRNDFELIRDIWVKNFDHFTIANGNVKHHKEIWPSDRNEKLMLNNVQSAHGDEWKNIRATFSPIFTSGKLRKMTPLLQVISCKMNEHVSNLARSGDAFETKDLAGKFSLDGLASCAFGVETGSFDEKESEFLRHGKNVFKFSGIVILKSLLSGIIPTPIKKAATRLGFGNVFKYPFANEHSKFLMQVVEASFKQRKESKTKRNDLLDLMIEAVEGSLDDKEDDDIHGNDQFEKDAKIVGSIKKKKLSYDDVIATAILLLAAGYDTTGSALSWILYDLAMNQNCQDTLYEEITESGKDMKHVSYETLQTLPYLDAVIHESLRLHPPIPGLERVCTKDYPIPNSNVVLRKGDLVGMATAGICLDPEVYPNPLEYIPDRFLKENSSKRNPYAFSIFSLGPRNCIGMRFSMYEMKCCISNLVAKFRLMPCDKTVPYEKLEYSKSDVFGGTTHGLWITCEER